MNLVKLLSENDLQSINNYRNYYAEIGRGNAAPMEDILDVWSSQKQSLYQLLGRKFILEKEIEISKDEHTILQEIKSNTNITTFRNNYDYIIRKNQDLFKNRDDFYEALQLVSLECLTNNTYTGNTFRFNTPDNREIIVQKGTKISRILGKISKVFEIEGYDAYNLASSKVFNQKKLKGMLCLSIHPLDYMTMSDNNSDWSSCMSWKNDGCYRQGTVEMMNSDCVVVAYLKSKNDMILCEDDTWNNKRWRNLFIVTSDIITSVKGYPYQSAELNTICIHWLEDLISANIPSWGAYEEKILEVEPDGSNFEICYCLDTAIELEFNTYQMYNDFGNGNLVNLTLNKKFRVPDNAGTYISITYSGPAQCMWCGSTNDYFNDNQNLVCDRCDNTGKCCRCDDSYSFEDLHEVDGEYYCEYCFNDSCYWDEIDQEYHAFNNAVAVYITDGREELAGERVTAVEQLPDYVTETCVYDISVLKNKQYYCYNRGYGIEQMCYINIFDQPEEIKKALERQTNVRFWKN